MLRFILFWLLAGVTWLQAVSPADRSVKICVASNASPEIRRAAQEILSAARTHPLLAVLAGAKTPQSLTGSDVLAKAAVEERAYDHLVLVGLPDDPLISAAWQREARMENGGMYIFGFGHLSGDIGYVESDRNPFLHSRAIKTAPYETEVITLTGTTPRGVALAVEAFLKQGLINGVVAAPGWTRGKPSLLAHDPLAPDFALPGFPAPQAGDLQRIGLTQASEDEYRAVLTDTGVSPQGIWRIKYYKPGVWDKPGAASAVEEYSYGLHKRAYGNTLWCARFASAAEAFSATAKIVAAAKLQASGDLWKGGQPPYGFGNDSAGPLTLRQRAEWVYLSTLPEKDFDVLAK